MSTVKYTQEHEWIQIEGDTGTFGITDYAAEQLGDVVYVELPEIGRTVKQTEEVAVVESVKAASEIYAPVSGEVIEVNTLLTDNPATVNEEPTGKGWFAKIKIADAGEADKLMDEAAYKSFVEGQS